MKNPVAFILLFAFLLLPAFNVHALPGDLTNKAIYSWSDVSETQWWTNTSFAATNYFKFIIISPGYDPANPSPQPGQTIHIPFVAYNVGSMASSPIHLGRFFTNVCPNLTFTVNSNQTNVFEISDTNQITQVPALASGEAFYYWLNIEVSTNLDEGQYPFYVTNVHTDPLSPLTVIYSNRITFSFQSVSNISASDGIHTITAFDGTALLGNMDVSVYMKFQRAPVTPYLYYDVDGVPDASLPDGTLTNNRRVPVTLLSNDIWVAKIPIFDPEIKEGKQVQFVISDSGQIFYYPGDIPFSYFVKNFASQPDNPNQPVIIANNVGDFTVKPVRLIYTLPRDGFVNVTVYNLRGEIIRKLRNERLMAGKYIESWDAKNDAGMVVSKGLYFMHISTADYSVTKKTLFVVR